MPQFSVTDDFQGQRVDKFLAACLPEFSRTDLQKILADKQVLFQGKAVAKNHKVQAGQILEVQSLPVKACSHLTPEPIPLNIVYEDQDLVVINKPRNLVVHPGNGNEKGTLAAGLLHHYQHLSQINGPLRPGILHRLDKDTPGLLVAARHDQAHQFLAQELENRRIERTYHALVWGQMSEASGLVETFIERDPNNRLRMAVRPQGKHALTHWKVLQTFRFCSLLELRLETGRTHQIRVHMRHVGHPVVGDPLYDGNQPSLHRLGPLDRPYGVRLLKLASQGQLLQAVRLAFEHPVSHQRMQFEIPHESCMDESLAFCHQELALDSVQAHEALFGEDSAHHSAEESDHE